jgi:small subunit ribosomal protein S6
MEENLRQYQISYFLSPLLLEEEVSNYTAKISEFINEAKGEIKSSDEPKIQKLSFPIKKHYQGYFSKIIFFISPENLSELEKKIRLEKDILRFFIEIVRPEKQRKEKPPKKSKPIQIKEDETEIPTEVPEKIKEEKETTKKKKVKLEEIDQKLEEIIGDI